jgi:hypothetical protein
MMAEDAREGFGALQERDAAPKPSIMLVLLDIV